MNNILLLLCELQFQVHTRFSEMPPLLNQIWTFFAKIVVYQRLRRYILVRNESFFSLVEFRPPKSQGTTKINRSKIFICYRRIRKTKTNDFYSIANTFIQPNFPIPAKLNQASRPCGTTATGSASPRMIDHRRITSFPFRNEAPLWRHTRAHAYARRYAHTRLAFPLPRPRSFPLALWHAFM